MKRLMLLVIQGLVGFLSGLMISIILILLVLKIFPIRNDLLGYNSLDRSILTLFISYPIGLIAGITMVSKKLQREGSLIRLIFGCIGGILIILLIWYLLQIGFPNWYIVIAFLLLPLVLGMIGYNLRFNNIKELRKNNLKND